MAKYWTHRMNLLYFSYQDFWKEVCDKIGITEEKVLSKLRPSYKERDENGQEVGRCRIERYAFWANRRSVLDESHYDRLRVLEDYIRMLYPRLVKEVRKEEEVQAYFKRPVTIPTVTKTKKKESGLEQLEFNFGGEE